MNRLKYRACLYIKGILDLKCFYLRLTSRVQEMLKDTMQRHERRMPNHHSPEQDDGSDADDSDHDNDKRTWCVCNQV